MSERTIILLVFYIIALMIFSCHHAYNANALFVTDTFGSEYRLIPSQKWIFDCDFPEQFKNEVRYGFSTWSNEIGVKLFSELNSCVPSSKKYSIVDKVVVVSYINAYANHNGKIVEQCLADTTRRTSGLKIVGGTINFYKTWSDKELWGKRTTAVHEVGHILGLMHTPNRSCIMHDVIWMPLYNFKKKNFCNLELFEIMKAYGESK